jgi:hypothetical protein
MLLHALDEYAIVTLAIIVLILIAVWRKKASLQELRKQHNIIAVIFVVALIFKLYAITAEMGDPADFGDEIQVLITLILALLNRFL